MLLLIVIIQASKFRRMVVFKVVGPSISQPVASAWYHRMKGREGEAPPYGEGILTGFIFGHFLEGYCYNGKIGQGIDVFVDSELDEKGNETYYWVVTKRPRYINRKETVQNFGQIPPNEVDDALIERMVADDLETLSW